MVYILLIIGFICLVKGADFFVSGSSAIARHFNVPTFIIGLTIVAFGTSMPEAAVSVTAAMKGANGIAVGNVLGSNIFNLLVVLGFSALIKSCPVSKSMMRFEYPLSVAAAAMIMIFCIGPGDHALNPVSYTHLDVYKRQHTGLRSHHMYSRCILYPADAARH